MIGYAQASLQPNVFRYSTFNPRINVITIPHLPRTFPPNDLSLTPIPPFVSLANLAHLPTWRCFRIASTNMNQSLVFTEELMFSQFRGDFVVLRNNAEVPMDSVVFVPDGDGIPAYLLYIRHRLADITEETLRPQNIPKSTTGNWEWAVERFRDGENLAPQDAQHTNTAAKSVEPRSISTSNQAEYNASREESNGSSKPSTSAKTVALTVTNKKKQNKKSKPAKKPTPEPVEPIPSPKPIPVVIEEATNRSVTLKSTQAALREDVTVINEDNFIHRVANLSGLEPEYLDFIARFMEQANATKHGFLKLQVELAETPAINESVNEKIAELQKLVDAAEATRAANAQQIADLQAELAAEKQDSAQSSAELKTLTFELDALQSGFIEKENLTQANNSFAEERKQHLAEIEDLKNQDTNKDGAITKLNHELRKAYNDSREHLAEVEEVKKALATSKEAELVLSGRCDVLGKELADHDKYAQDSKSTIYELQNEVKSMEREKNDIKQQLREDREFEKVETVAPVTSAPPAEDSATKEQTEKLEKELEAAQKKIAELEAAQKESSAQTPAIEQEVVALKAKRNELAETNVKLAAAVRDAEAMAKQIEADATAANATTLKTVVDTLGEALSSAGVKINSNVPSSVDGLQKWIQSVADAIKKATAKSKEAAPASAPEVATSSPDSEEVEQLKEKVADYEDQLANVAKHIEAIEEAYHEHKHDQEKKLAALQARN